MSRYGSGNTEVSEPAEYQWSTPPKPDDLIEVVHLFPPKEAIADDGNWYILHKGCEYYAKHDSICNKCGAYVKREGE